MSLTCVATGVKPVTLRCLQYMRHPHKKFIIESRINGRKFTVMDFNYSEEQLMIQAAARDFAQSEIAPIAAAHDASGEFPAKTVRMMGELGLMGVEVPEQ